MVDYDLGHVTKLAVSIFDEVRKGDNKSMGSAVFDLGDVLGARGSTQGKKVKGGGSVYLHARKSVGSGTLRLKMKGTKLKNVEGFLSKRYGFKAMGYYSSQNTLLFGVRSQVSSVFPCMYIVIRSMKFQRKLMRPVDKHGIMFIDRKIYITI